MLKDYDDENNTCCIEYVGTTTISRMLNDWKLNVMGEPFYMGLIHDHSKLPHTSGHPDDTTLEEQEQILNHPN